MSQLREGASPFNALEEAFGLLAEGPHPVTLSGYEVPGLPKRAVPLTELRSRVLHPSCRYVVRDAVVDTLLRRAQAEGGAWVVALTGMLLPGLRRSSISLIRACPASAEDVQAEMVSGLIAAIAAASPGRPRPAARLVWAAHRSAEHLVREELAEQDHSRLTAGSAEPPRPFGHPDLVLARAVADGVLSAEDAELIGATRLGELSLDDAREALGLGKSAIKMRRGRAERALVAWIRGEFVTKGPDNPGSTGAGRPRTGRRLGRWSRLRSDRITEKEVGDGPHGPSGAPLRPARPPKPPTDRRE